MYAQPGTDARTAFLETLRSTGRYTDAFLSGLDMNVRDESGWNPGINEAAPVVPGSRGGFGLIQWTGPRRRALEAFAAKRRMPVSDPRLQALFFDHEAQTTERRSVQAALAASTPGEAAATLTAKFFRPAAEHRDRRIAKYTGGGGSMGGVAMGARNAASAASGALGGLFGPEDDLPMFEQGPGPLPPLTGRERIGRGLAGVSELFGALGRGHAPTWEATDRFIEQQNEQRALRGAGPLAKKDVNQTIEWLTMQGRPDLADIVARGGLDAEDAVKEALANPAADPEAADPVEAVALQLDSMNRPDLSAAVRSGGMETQKALEIALGDRPVPGQELSTEQLGFAQAQQRELTQGLQSVEALNTAVNNIEIMAQNEGRFSDSVMLQAFAKALDPLSVVREGEVSFIQSAASGLRGYVSQLQSMVDPTSGRLDPAIRQQLLDAARTLRANALTTANARYKQSAAQTKAMGINPDLWLPNPETMFPSVRPRDDAPPGDDAEVPPWVTGDDF